MDRRLSKIWKKLSLRDWGFSHYERRAIWLLIILLLVGSAFRYSKHRRIADKFALWSQVPDSLGLDSISLEQFKPKPLEPVDLNNSSVGELELIPGIGPKKALLIANYRDTNGGFNTVDELRNVFGIGDKTLEMLKPFVVISESSANKQELTEVVDSLNKEKQR